jgi:hypothetical protein
VEDVAAKRPFIAALAISKVHGGLPAPRFIDCVRRLKGSRIVRMHGRFIAPS